MSVRGSVVYWILIPVLLDLSVPLVLLLRKYWVDTKYLQIIKRYEDTTSTHAPTDNLVHKRENLICAVSYVLCPNPVSLLQEINVSLIFSYCYLTVC